MSTNNDSDSYDYLSGYKHISFKLAENHNEINADYYNIKNTLANIGVELDINTHNELTISILPETFIPKTTRNAGAKKKLCKIDETNFVYSNRTPSTHKLNVFYYSDICYMIYAESLSDKDIMEKVNLKRATYYRHKKEMLNSFYYKNLSKLTFDSLDSIKIDDLRNVKGDLPF